MDKLCFIKSCMNCKVTNDVLFNFLNSNFSKVSFFYHLYRILIKHGEVKIVPSFSKDNYEVFSFTTNILKKDLEKLIKDYDCVLTKNGGVYSIKKI